MGKYSIDSYERYPQQMWRPSPAEDPPRNRGYGLLTEGEILAGGPLALPAPSEVEAIRARGEEPFALLIDLREQDLLEAAERLARLGLQRHWQRAPVCALLKGEPDPETRRALHRWHVRAADREAGLGLDIRPRRVSCPRTVSAGGALPLRLWLTSTGSSPLYEPARLHLRLRGAAAEAMVPLDHPAALLRRLGDLVHNQILSLPPLPPGIYEAALALLRADGQPVHLNALGAEPGGYLPLGRLALDDRPRPEYFHIWDDYYPEGYYPLEDPKEPKGDEE